MARAPFNPDRVRVPTAALKLPTGPLTVSQLTAMVKQAIEVALPATVHVVGQMSNFKRHSSGHLYFTLKDGASELSCVMWRSAVDATKFAPKDGLEVIASGTVEVFERAGRYQLYVRRLEPRGVGALELAFRQLCEKLQKDGLFDPTRKRAIPKFPRQIAVVTSPTGAALTDIVRTIHRRFPCVQILLHPVRVQGSGAAEEIAAAIRRVNANRVALGGIEVMIVGRGGGSLEDLWAFNEEIVARAIFASEVPVISAVGHEVDVTIADLVADLRAATPTAAGELAVPMLDDVLTRIAAAYARLERAAGSRLALRRAHLQAIEHRAVFRDPLSIVRRRELELDEFSDRMTKRAQLRASRARHRLERCVPSLQRIAPHRYLLAMTERLRHREARMRRNMTARVAFARRKLERVRDRWEAVSPTRRVAAMHERVRALGQSLPVLVGHALRLCTARLDAGEKRLEGVSPQSVLARGYSMTWKAKGRTLVRSLRDVRDRERVVTRVMDGEFESEVVDLRQLELFRSSCPNEN